MNALHTILVTVILVAWLLLTVTVLIASIQGLFNDRKREKREVEQARRDKKRYAHDLEYHEKRMAALEKETADKTE